MVCLPETTRYRSLCSQQRERELCNIHESDFSKALFYKPRSKLHVWRSILLNCMFQYLEETWPWTVKPGPKNQLLSGPLWCFPEFCIYENKGKTGPPRPDSTTPGPPPPTLSKKSVLLYPWTERILTSLWVFHCSCLWLVECRNFASYQALFRVR